uniref:Uncharacterized protein n=1 Tax=Arundo donax TaxID=35708 RepID=A0A0A9ATF5_ARUDO
MVETNISPDRLTPSLTLEQKRVTATR